MNLMRQPDSSQKLLRLIVRCALCMKKNQRNVLTVRLMIVCVLWLVKHGMINSAHAKVIVVIVIN